MSLPIGIGELLEEGKVENQRIEYKEGWDPELILPPSRHLPMTMKGILEATFSSG